jgi:hypothetical protein
MNNPHANVEESLALVRRNEARNAAEAVNRSLALAENIGADRSANICQYARRPTPVPLAIVANQILDGEAYFGLKEITEAFAYKYVPPPSVLALKASIQAGESTAPVMQLLPVLEKEIENGRLMVDARKALVLSLKHLHSFFKRKGRTNQSWNSPANKEEAEPLVRMVLANLLFLLVRKKLKEIHNVEARRLMAMLRQAPREAEGNSEIEAINAMGARTTIQPMFDDFIVNVLNQILISWPGLAILYHLNNGAIGTRGTKGTMPEILGSLEKAIEFVNGDLAKEMADVWAPLNTPPVRIPEELAANIRAAAVAGPAPQASVPAPAVSSLLDRIFDKVPQDEKDEGRMLLTAFQGMRAAFSGAASRLVETITTAYRGLKRERALNQNKNNVNRANVDMEWEPTEVLAILDKESCAAIAAADAATEEWREAKRQRLKGGRRTGKNKSKKSKKKTRKNRK